MALILDGTNGLFGNVTGGDVSGNFIIDSVNLQDGSVTQSKIAPITATGSTEPRNLQDRFADVVNVLDFGAVGDGVADDTAAIQAAIDSAYFGNIVLFGSGEIYKCTDTIICKSNTTIELNGSKIKFVITGSTNCLQTRDNVTIRNGEVELAGSSYTGHGGNGCPIIVGDYESGIGYKKIKVENVVITGNKDGGNAFFITGDSENVVFENIEIPGPTVLGNYGCHWGNVSNPTSGTTHPNNIVMRNIKMGTSTHSDAIGAVTSGCYDVLMENLIFDQMPKHCVYVFCGDYGMQFASDANIKAHGIHNIKIRNVTGKRVGYPIYVDMFKNVAPATPEKEICNNVIFENCSFFGNDPTNSSKFGFRLRYSENILMENCVFNNFYNAGRITLSSENNKFNNCKFYNSRTFGVFTTITGETSSTPNRKNIFQNCVFKDNNQENSASVSDIYFKWGGLNEVNDCRFDSPLMPWNVRIDTGTNSSYGNTIKNNLIVSPPTSVCFSFGSSTDYSLVDLFVGNRMLNQTQVPPNGFTGGQLHLPFDTTSQGSNRVSRKMAAEAIPTANIWAVGDTIFFRTPTAGGHIGAVCVTEGTPGTWKTFGTISA